MKSQELRFENPPLLVLSPYSAPSRRAFWQGVAVGLALLGSSALQATAQAVPPAKPGPASGELPSVQQILEMYVSALGGRPAIEKLNSRVLKGWVEYPGQGVSGEIEIAAKAPDKLRATFRLPGDVVEEGYDGTVAWEANSREGVFAVRRERGANIRIEAQFYSDLRLAELFPQLKLTGTEVVEGQPAYVLEGVPLEGSRRWFYFSVKTGLLVRQDSEQVEPPRAGRYSTHLKNYQEFDGVKIPMAWDQEGAGVKWTIRFAEVRHNVPLDDARFKKPKPESH